MDGDSERIRLSAAVFGITIVITRLLSNSNYYSIFSISNLVITITISKNKNSNSNYYYYSNYYIVITKLL